MSERRPYSMDYDTYPIETCGQWMPRAGEACGLSLNHPLPHRSATAVAKMRAADTSKCPSRQPATHAKYARDRLANMPEEKREANRARTLRHRANQRAKVFAHYGETCACCGAAGPLTIDHVAGDGRDNRETTHRLYKRLIDTGFPIGYQTLCAPCNSSKGSGHTCGKHGRYLGGTRRGLRIRPSHLFDAVDDPDPIDWAKLTGGSR